MPTPAPISQFPVLDRDAAQTFLEFLDPDTDEFTFQSFTDSELRKKSYQKNPHTGQIIDPLAKVLHGTLDEHWATLVDLSRKGAGIFVTVNKTTLRGRRNLENTTEVRAYFVDCDGIPEDQIRAGIVAIKLIPHIVVKSSEGKYHIYWCVNDAPLAGFSETQKKLAALLGSDPAVCDSPRVLRVPGFPHQKDGSKGELVQLLYTHEGANYSDAEFQRALMKAVAARGWSVSLAASLGRSALPAHLQHREGPRIAERALEGLGNPSPDWSQGYPEGQRNNECARRAGSCLARGMSEEETCTECLRWNAEHNDPPLDEVEVRATVASIARTHARKQAAVVSLAVTKMNGAKCGRLSACSAGLLYD